MSLQNAEKGQMNTPKQQIAYIDVSEHVSKGPKCSFPVFWCAPEMFRRILRQLDARICKEHQNTGNDLTCSLGMCQNTPRIALHTQNTSRIAQNFRLLSK